MGVSIVTGGNSGIGAGRRCEIRQLDLHAVHEGARAVDQLAGKLGGVDVLVNKTAARARGRRARGRRADRRGAPVGGEWESP